MRYYQPANFKIEELVYPDIYKWAKTNGRLELLWGRFNIGILETAQLLREHYGVPIVINNWHVGGSFSLSGLRPVPVFLPDGGYLEGSKPSVGASLSVHQMGGALDMKFKGISAEQVREDMRSVGAFEEGAFENPEFLKSPFRYIRRVEWLQNGKPISWFHADTSNTDYDHVYIVNV